jgi:hypothetical protein
MKILCKLPNAASVINGVKFFEHKLGVLSEEVEESVAAEFLKIEGYIRMLPPKAEAEAPTPAVSAAPSDAAAPPAAPTPSAPSTPGGASN